MATLFINYNANAALAADAVFISQERGGLFNECVIGLVEDMVNDRSGSCPLEGSLEALEDGAAWAGTNATEEILEMLHDAVVNFKQE